VINLRSIFNLYSKLKIELEILQIQKEIDDLNSLLDENDEELVELAKEEIPVLLEKQNLLKQKLKETDPNDKKNAIVEIQAGVGGDESSLFAADLYRMYEIYAQDKGFNVETLDFTPGNVGGFKNITFIIQGKNAYKLFKNESGGHRVQRVPTTESKGRVHTSIATVAVLPEILIENININKADVKTENFSAGGPGGQNVNKNHCAVRLTHIPTKISVVSRTKSLQANLKYCWKVLASRLCDHQLQQKETEEVARKKELRGTGMRNERIRTYNFPQNRVTDHRIKIKYSLNLILEGKLDAIVAALAKNLN
jgi:peptide chain release factor 1